MFDSDTQNRFMSRIEQRGPDECWPWLGGKNSAGYGVFRPRSGSPVLATRYACGMATRHIPDRSTYCLHSCDNPACCNPKHLRWGTPTDNVQDAIRRKRHKMPPPAKGNPNPPKGEAVWSATLTADQVRAIWRLHLAGLPATKTAAEVGASAHVVRDVTRGRSWRHLPDAPPVEELRKGGVRRGWNQFA